MVAATICANRADGLARPQIERMASAFEHKDMERARRL
jgi:hypothetical protein